MATTTNYSWTTPDDTDLVKDGASAIRSLGTAIDSTVFTNAGNAVQKSTIDAKGDLLVGTADNTITRLAVGTNNYVLTADSNEASGVKWAAAAGGGKVLQVVNATYSTETTISTGTYTDTGLSVTITPSSASSKVLIFVTQPVLANRAYPAIGSKARIMRDSTEIIKMTLAHWFQLTSDNTAKYLAVPINFNYLDSPATTSAITYKTQMGAQDGGTLTAQWEGGQDDSTASITVMEIGA